MRTFIRGAAVEKAESYTLFEIVDGEYEPRGTATEINFEISKLEGLKVGEHKFVVQAHSNDINYESSEYSESVSYSVLGDETPETPDDGGNTGSGTETPGDGEDEDGNTDSETYTITYESYYKDSPEEEYKKANNPTTYFTYENIQSIIKGQSYENTFTHEQDFFDRIEVYIGDSTTPLTFDEASITIEATKITGDLLIKMYSYDRASSN